MKAVIEIRRAANIATFYQCSKARFTNLDLKELRFRVLKRNRCPKIESVNMPNHTFSPRYILQSKSYLRFIRLVSFSWNAVHSYLIIFLRAHFEYELSHIQLEITDKSIDCTSSWIVLQLNVTSLMWYRQIMGLVLSRRK